MLSIKEAIKEGLGVDLGNEIELISDFFKESLEISPTQLVRFLKESVEMWRETSKSHHYGINFKNPLSIMDCPGPGHTRA